MANNQNIAISDLERGKFRPDATEVDSTIQSYNTAPLQYRDPDKVSEVGDLIYSNHPEFKKG